MTSTGRVRIGLLGYGDEMGQERDAKLVQYLNEAYGKEKQLVTALEAHIAMTTRAPYKKRLKAHLKETKAHAKAVERRIKQLGGKADAVPVPGPEPIADAAAKVQEVASRAVAAAKGPLHMVRGTGEAEKMLKNAETEFSEEYHEIAKYTAIEALAESVGDKETAKLARGIRKEEERMAAFLGREIQGLAKAVAKEEIPAAQRRMSTGATRRRKASGGSSRKASGAKSSGSRSRKAAKAGKASR